MVSDTGISGVINAIATSIAQTDFLTWSGTILALVYVVLALRLNRWCWVAGIASSIIFVAVYFNSALYYESALNILYAMLGVYGWISWKDQSSASSESVRKSSSAFLIYGSAIALASGLVLGTITYTLLNADLAYADALLTTFSVFATVLSARKLIENWIYWIVIDAASSVVYIIKGPSMYLVAVLFILYTCMAIGGYYSWKKKLEL
jgi:nicotinamide mononucleotide transporter